MQAPLSSSCVFNGRPLVDAINAAQDHSLTPTKQLCHTIPPFLQSSHTPQDLQWITEAGSALHKTPKLGRA